MKKSSANSTTSVKKPKRKTSNYKKGAKREDWVTNQLRKELPFVIGTPGSHSQFDVIATDFNNVNLWIQVKSNTFDLYGDESYGLAEIANVGDINIHRIILIIIKDCKAGESLKDNCKVYRYRGLQLIHGAKYIESERLTWFGLINYIRSNRSVHELTGQKEIRK